MYHTPRHHSTPLANSIATHFFCFSREDKGEDNGWAGHYLAGPFARLGFSKAEAVRARINHAFRGDPRSMCCIRGPRPIGGMWRGAFCQVDHRRLPSVEIVDPVRWNRRWGEMHSGRSVLRGPSKSPFRPTEVEHLPLLRLWPWSLAQLAPRRRRGESRTLRHSVRQRDFRQRGILQISNFPGFATAGLQECARLRLLSNGDLEAYWCEGYQGYGGSTIYSLHNNRVPMCPTSVSELDDMRMPIN